MSTYKVENEANKLTIEEMNAYDMYEDIDEAVAENEGVPYTGTYIKGLPLELRNSKGPTVHQNSRL